MSYRGALYVKADFGPATLFGKPLRNVPNGRVLIRSALHYLTEAEAKRKGGEPSPTNVSPLPAAGDLCDEYERGATGVAG